MEAAIHGCDQRSPVVEFNHPRLEEALHLEQRGADSGGFVQGTSSVLWPAAQRMAQFLLDTQAETLPGRSLLELGAGVGLVGAACAACGARAVLTDWEGALPLLRRNAELLAQRGVMVEVARLDWGSADQEAILADTPGGFDLLVGSDIILSSFDLEALWASCRALLARRAGARLFLAFEFREDWESIGNFIGWAEDAGMAVTHQALGEEDDEIYLYTFRWEQP